jgi:GAF domain-containing protein
MLPLRYLFPSTVLPATCSSTSSQLARQACFRHCWIGRSSGASSTAQSWFHLCVLELLAAQAAISLENAQLHEHEQASSVEAEAGAPARRIDRAHVVESR